MRKKLTDMNPVDDIAHQSTRAQGLGRRTGGGMQCAYHILRPGDRLHRHSEGKGTTARSVRG